MEKRMITTDVTEEDLPLEGSLRPQTLDEYIGQEKTKRMKHGKNPTKAQKRIIAYYKLDPADWMVSKATDKQLCLVHRYTDKIRWIDMVRIEEPRKVKATKYA